MGFAEYGVNFVLLVLDVIMALTVGGAGRRRGLAAHTPSNTAVVCDFVVGEAFQVLCLRTFVAIGAAGIQTHFG